MQKRKYDFSRAEEETPKEESRLENVEIKTNMVEESKEYSKTIESLEQLRTETDLIWE